MTSLRADAIGMVASDLDRTVLDPEGIRMDLCADLDGGGG